MIWVSRLSECIRDIVSGTTRGAIWFTLLTTIFSFLITTDISAAERLSLLAGTYQDAAADIRSISSPGMIDGMSCDLLSTSQAIQASGALAVSDSMFLLSIPDVSIQAYRVSPGFAHVLRIVTQMPTGVWIDSNLASTLHLVVGESLSSSRGVLLVAGIFKWPNDGRDGRLTFSIVIPELAVGRFDECWIRAWPPADDSNDSLALESISSSEEVPSFAYAQINPSFGVGLSVSREWKYRPTRFATLSIAVASFIIAFASVRGRRLEHASALHAGIFKQDILIIANIETLAWSIPSLLTGSILAYVFASHVGVDYSIPVVLTSVAVFSMSILGTSTCVIMTKEKYLFQYFKTR